MKNSILSKRKIAAVLGLLCAANAFSQGEPAITSHPQGQIVSRGSTVTFSVSAIGDGRPFQYRWRRNGHTLTPFQTNSTLVVTNANVGTNGNFDVVVSYPGTRGVLSKNAHLASLTSAAGRME